MRTYPGPWAPFTPTASEPWDLAKVAHLHRRAGFGATWDELHRDLQEGPEASLNRLLHPPEPSDDERQVMAGLRQGVLQSRDLARLKAWWLYRMRFDPDPLRETLTLVWHGHFATSIRKVQSVAAMLRQNETLRRHALGSFADLLNAVVADPAMLVWLDGGTSRQQKPNENFAREFFELFTLGPGPYTEADIREAARAFTGWVRAPGGSGPRDDPVLRFESDAHDDGAKTILGQTGPWDAADVVRITLEQPQAATFLAHKLYRAFIREDDEPSPDLIEPLAAALRASDFDIRHVVGVILRSRLFFSQASYRQRIKSPVAYSVGLVRMLDVPRADLNLLALAAALDRQGQELFAPPNVKGWDGGPAWITTTTLLERTHWATDVLWGHPDFGMRPFDPLAWAARQGLDRDEAADVFVDLLLDGNLEADLRVLALQPAREGDGPPSADALRATLQRLLHTPEFQLA